MQTPAAVILQAPSNQQAGPLLRDQDTIASALTLVQHLKQRSSSHISTTQSEAFGVLCNSNDISHKSRCPPRHKLTPLNISRATRMGMACICTHYCLHIRWLLLQGQRPPDLNNSVPLTATKGMVGFSKHEKQVSSPCPRWSSPTVSAAHPPLPLQT